MPVFHTKTIESILEPVALQVSRLVILHEEAEDGNAMPDLEKPVQVVSKAVSNLVKVGKETISSSADPILRQDMPAALVKVEHAAGLLEEASRMLHDDPWSAPARRRLIEGSGGILQATSALLLCFDESEVRKLVRECNRVLDYLAVVEVIETMEELVQFLRDLSPCLSKVSREVSSRSKELTHQVHAEALIRCLDQVKTLAPILICSMKVYIHILSGGAGTSTTLQSMKPTTVGLDEAAENRNYLANRMSDEINEIIRVLQLTTYDEDQSDLDNTTVLKKLLSGIQNKMNPACDWLMDPQAVKGGIGEKSLRQILEAAEKIAERCLPQDSSSITHSLSSLNTMTNSLCELRSGPNATTPQAEALARGIKDSLHAVHGACAGAVQRVDKAGLTQPAHTVAGRLEQARKWLSAPGGDSAMLSVGRGAIRAIVQEGRKVAEGLPGIHKSELLSLCDQVSSLCEQLNDLCSKGQGNSPQGQEIAKQLAHQLHELKTRIQQALVTRVVEDFMDIASPLKGFVEAVQVPEGTPNRDQNFSDKAANLQQFSNRAVKTAKMVAAGGSGGNKKLAEALLNASSQVDSLTPQLISAGSIRMNYPQSKAADEHFENLKQQYADTVQRVRNLCDEATDSADFIKASEEQMQKHTFLCEESIRGKLPQKMVDNTSSIARLANRVLLVAKQESDNSEDPAYIHDVNQAADHLQLCVPPMVQDAKQVAVNPTDGIAVSKWRDSNKALLTSVGLVRQAVQVHPELPPLPDLNQLNMNVVGSVRNIPSPRSGDLDTDTLCVSPSAPGRLSPLPRWARGPNNSDLLCQQLTAGTGSELQDSAPPRPPPPSMPLSSGPPSRPPPPETDDEDDVFTGEHAHSSHPIMRAARGLHQEVRQWSSKDNDMVAAAKQMALLMARLSELVRRDCKSSKRELIATAKALAEAGEEVTRLAKILARECTDKRIRTNLLQVCERIPTIGTQLKILSTVKATMLGAQGSEEDREATEMLEGNAQNLMQSVKETVRAAESASIKIHTQSQGRLQWVRRLPWYHY